MTDEHADDCVQFNETVARALAESAWGTVPRADLRASLLARVSETAGVPAGFRLELAVDRRRKEPACSS